MVSNLLIKPILIYGQAGLLVFRLFSIRRKYQTGCSLDQAHSVTIANRAILAARIAMESSLIYTISFAPFLALAGVSGSNPDSAEGLKLLLTGLGRNVCSTLKSFRLEVCNAKLMLFYRSSKLSPYPIICP
jgi:hypothetical protein